MVDADDLEGPAGWAGRRGLWLGGRLRGVQERRTLRAVPYTTVASAWLVDFVGGLGVPRERVLRVPNGHAVAPVSEWRVSSHGTGSSSRRVARDLPLEGANRPRALATRNSELLWYTRFTDASPKRAAGLLAPLLRRNPALGLTVLGDELGGGDRAALQTALTREGVAGQVRWVGYEEASRDDHLNRFVASGVAVYPMDDDAVNRARCPSKIPHLMALGIPIVAEAVGEIPSYLAGFGRECVAPPGDADGFRGRVEALLAASRQKRSRLGNALQQAAEQWRWDRVAGGLLGWYEAALRVAPAP